MQLLALLFGVAFTCSVSYALGTMLLGAACGDRGIRFVTGAAILSLGVFGLCATGLVYPLVFLALGAAVLLAGQWNRAGKTLRVLVGRPSWSARDSLVTPAPELPLPAEESPIQGAGKSPLHRFRLSTALWTLAFGTFAVLYLSNSMAPEISPDGSAYHLGLVSRYLREHGFVPIPDNLYSAMPGGMEMLFLFAFAFGRHSAAATVHLAFLAALAWQLFTYGRRRGFPAAGTSAALIVFASPVFGIDASSAYNDVAVAAIAFTLFHLLELWDDEPNPRLLAAIGLTAGFAFAVKYTAWSAIPYAAGFVLLKNRKAFVPVALFATLAVAPWLLKNWFYFHNPVAPFFNRQFPNPYVMPGFEDFYRHMMATYDLKSRWQIPMQVTTYGEISGLLGPVFLLAPLGLLALRRKEGRRLWFAALVFSVSYFSNIAARFLIPPAPFVTLALALALSAVPRLAVVVALASAIISWPAMVARYARPHAWRQLRVPWQEALRIRPEERYLEYRLDHYKLDRLIDEKTAPGSTIFTIAPIPEAYTSRKIRVEYQSAANQIAARILWSAVSPEAAPTGRLRFAFPRQALRGLRVVQTRQGGDTWSIHEFRIWDGGRELPRAPGWRLTARPTAWGVQDAFDNSLATFWLCGEPLRPGQFVEVVFHSTETADSVVLETAPNQWGAAFGLEGQDAAGRWVPLSAAPTPTSAPRPLGLRRAVAEELKRRGIDYLLVFNTDNGATDLRLNLDLWGMRLAGEEQGARLYQLP